MELLRQITMKKMQSNKAAREGYPSIGIDSRKVTPSKAEAEKLAIEDLHSNDIKYGSNEEFDVFDINEDSKTATAAEDAYSPASLSLTSENIELQCRTCFKWVDICCYK